MANRNTYRYTMREGNRIIKYGITKDPDRREIENLRDGSGDKMRIEGSRVSEQSARDWERLKIDAYTRRNGHLPPRNDA